MFFGVWLLIKCIPGLQQHFQLDEKSPAKPTSSTDDEDNTKTEIKSTSADDGAKTQHSVATQVQMTEEDISGSQKHEVVETKQATLEQENALRSELTITKQLLAASE